MTWWISGINLSFLIKHHYKFQISQFPIHSSATMLPIIKGKEPTETICPQCKEETTTKIENIFSGKVIQVK